MPKTFRLLLLSFCCCFLNTARAQSDTVLFQVVKDGKIGYEDMAGRLVAGYYPQLKIHPPRDGYIIVTNDSGKSAAIDLTGRMVVPFIYRGLTYLPEQRWWVAKPNPDSIRIFPLDGGPDIYCGPGGSALVNPVIDRIIITTTSSWNEQAARLLNMKGREIAAITGPGGNAGFTGFDFIPDNPHHSLNPPYNRRYLKVMHGGATALADLNGRILVDSVGVGGFYDGAMLLVGKDRIALLDTFLHEIIPFSAGYSMLKPLEGTAYYFATKRDGSTAVIDRQQRVLIPFAAKEKGAQLAGYDADFIELAVYLPYSRYSVYDYSGKRLLTSNSRLPVGEFADFPDFPWPVQLNDTLCRLWKSGRFIGRSYNHVSYYLKSGYAVFERGDETGLLDSLGNEVLATHYYEISYPVDGILSAGERIKCRTCREYSCALQEHTVSDHWAYQYFLLDMAGRRIGQESFDLVQHFHDGQALVSKDCNSYWIDTAGKRVPASAYTSLTNRKCGIKIVQDEGGRQYIMGGNGRIISPPATSFEMLEGHGDYFTYFKNGRSENGLHSGKSRQPKLERGLIVFKQGESAGLMDTLGRIVVPAGYLTISVRSNFILVRTADEHFGLMDAAGKVVLPAVYNEIRIADGYFVIRKEESGPRTVFRL